MKRIGTSFLLYFFLLVVAACQPDAPDVPETPDPDPESSLSPESISYLALGDSYTIGESVGDSLRWPVQLADSLSDEGIPTEVQIIARTGWTTSELQAGIENAIIEVDTFDIVSLLIGVNNQFRGQSIEVYKSEFRELLEQSITLAGGRTDNVFVLSIPDYGVTPFAANRNPARIAEEIDQFNAAHQAICDSMSIRWFDITEISRRAPQEPDLIAEDQLHPSGEMYREWVHLIFDEVKAIAESP